MVLIGVFATYHLYLNHLIRSELQIIRDEKLPTTLAEFFTWHSPPSDSEILANPLRQVFDQLVPVDEGDKDLVPMIGDNIDNPSDEESPFGQPLSKEMIEAAERYLHANTKALSLLDSLILRDLGPFTKGDETFLQYSQFRDRSYALLNLLEIRTILAAERGNVASALLEIEKFASLCRALSNGVRSVSQFWESGMYGRLAWLMQRILNRQTLSDDQLDRLSRLLPDEDPQGMRNRITADRAFLLEMSEENARNMAEIWKPSWNQIALRWLEEFAGARSLDYWNSLKIYRSAIEFSKLPLPDRFRAADAFWDQRIRWYGGDAMNVSLLSMASVLQEPQSIALYRAVRTALAVEKYRLAQASLPEQLSDLTPRFLKAILIDPYTGKDLSYKKIEGGFLIYSVGSDLAEGTSQIEKDHTISFKGEDVSIKVIRP